MEIGSKGLAEARLTIPQACSVTFEIRHKDADGQPIDHTGSILHMALQRMGGGPAVDLGPYCTGTSSGVTVTIPAEATEGIALGLYHWDIIAETIQGETIRLVYGTAEVVDTYALDSE